MSDVTLAVVLGVSFAAHVGRTPYRDLHNAYVTFRQALIAYQPALADAIKKLEKDAVVDETSPPWRIRHPQLIVDLNSKIVNSGAHCDENINNRWQNVAEAILKLDDDKDEIKKHEEIGKKIIEGILKPSNDQPLLPEDPECPGYTPYTLGQTLCRMFGASC